MDECFIQNTNRCSNWPHKHTHTHCTLLFLSHTKVHHSNTYTPTLYERWDFFLFLEKPSELINWLNNILHSLNFYPKCFNNFIKCFFFFIHTLLSLNSFRFNYKVGRGISFYFDYITPTFKTNGWKILKKARTKKKVKRKKKSIQMNTWTANIYTYRRKR